MLKKIGDWTGLIAVFLIGFSACAHAAGEEVIVSLNQGEITLGDSAILTITVEGIPDPEVPELGEIPGFDVRFRGMRQQSFSSMTVIVNGRRVKDEKTGGGYNFDFELTPKAAGVFTIPAFSIVINQERFLSSPFEIKVLDQSERRADIFIEVDTDKTEAYLGEKILATFKWYFSKDIGNYRINIPWFEGMKNLLVTDPELDRNRSYQRLVVNTDKQAVVLKSREFYRGQEYAVISFQKILTPMAAGIYTLEPVFLKCDVVTGYRRARRRSLFDSFFDSDFDDFFGFGRDRVCEPFVTRSNQIVLTIKEVPIQGSPAEYNGAVGSFTFEVDVKPVSLKVGEPVTLTMKVAGSGNIKQLRLPHIPDMESFKSYEPESKINVSSEGGEVRGEKIFEKVLIPRCAGDYRIPEVTFAFFNPQTGSYQTETRGPFEIHVARAEKEDEVRVIAITPEGPRQAQKRELKLLKKDIHYIMTDIGRIISSKKPAYESAAARTSVFLIPLLMLGAMFAFGKRRRRLSVDIAFARSRAALKNSREFFRLAEAALKKQEARSFYDFLIKGVNVYLAEKLNRQLGSIGADIADELKEDGVKEDECSCLKDLYRTANEVIFSSLPAPRQKLKRDFEAVKAFIQRLERILR